MKNSSRYEAVFKKSRLRYIPKKLLKHTKIRVSDKYTFNASIWVADTPESNFRPTINLTLQHNGDKVRFCFNDVADLLMSMDELRNFVAEKLDIISTRHSEAVREYLDYHEETKLPPINDYTVYTVIQDKKNRDSLVDKRTGEVIRTIFKNGEKDEKEARTQKRA